jgi:hypothetical protein
MDECGDFPDICSNCDEIMKDGRDWNYEQGHEYECDTCWFEQKRGFDGPCVVCTYEPAQRKLKAKQIKESLVALALRLVEVIRLKNLYIDQLEYEVAEAPNHSDI